MINNELLSIDNGVDRVIEADATLVAKEYYTEYAKYVLEYRALPSVYDGLKPVQRRIIYTANQYPQKLMKTAKMSGAVLQYHPHGSSSVTGAINEMAHPLNVFPMFKTKGNFGGVGFSASADRYTELYLSDIARMNFCQFIDYADYEVGEIGEMEPSSLPTLIPYCMIKGSEGIGIGLSTKVMPLNLIDLIDYYIDYIKNDGHSKKFVRPDIGYVLLEMDDQDIQNAVSLSKGRVTASSLVNQISGSTFLVEGLFDKSIDSVISKIDKHYHWFSQDKVGFRDTSTTSLKYIFEIYDSSVDPNELKEAIIWATRKSNTFSRVLEEDSNAIYSTFNYVVKKSLECLNRAIDNKINTELIRNESQLKLYQVLRNCKDSSVFDNITKITTDELVSKIMLSSGCDEEVAKEVVKKPISYLTRSHDDEEKLLESRIEDLKNHDRKKYLIKLYKEFRRAVLPYYEEKKHTVTKSGLIKNPCIKMVSRDDLRVTDGDGDPFNNTVYFVTKKGKVCPRTLNTVSASSIIVETDSDDEVVGFVTDNYKFIEITTGFNYEGWEGVTIIPLDEVSYEKTYVSLRSEDNEEIVKVKGTTSVSKEYKSALRGSRVCKTKFFKV